MAIGGSILAARRWTPERAKRAPQQPDDFVRADLLANMASARARELGHVPKRSNVYLGVSRPASVIRLLPVNRPTNAPPVGSRAVSQLKARSLMPRSTWRTAIAISPNPIGG